MTGTPGRSADAGKFATAKGQVSRRRRSPMPTGTSASEGSRSVGPTRMTGQVSSRACPLGGPTTTIRLGSVRVSPRGRRIRSRVSAREPGMQLRSRTCFGVSDRRGLRSLGFRPLRSRRPEQARPVSWYVRRCAAKQCDRAAPSVPQRRRSKSRCLPRGDQAGTAGYGPPPCRGAAPPRSSGTASIPGPT